MIVVNEYRGQAVGVFGLGKAGEATITSLLAGGAMVYAWDDRQQSVVTLSKDVHAIHFNDWPWRDIKALILSPGVPFTHPVPHEVVTKATQHQCPVIGDIELLYRAQPDARYVAITGTNGKSTTTTLIGHILRSAGIHTQIGGNLGTAALALEPLNNNGVYVIETSSYQLDLLQTTHFNIAALLNITPDHLDRHGDMEGYIAAKMHIFARQTKNDMAVIAVDDAYTKTIAAALQHVVVTPVSTQAKTDLYVENGVLVDGGHRFDLTGIVTLTGRHNWQNAVVAYGVARALGVAPDVIYRAMQSFAGLRHRMQLVATINGVRFINDSKATNADATSNALAPYNPIYWILGGKAKMGGIATLGEYFPKIAHAFLIGAAEEEFAATLEGRVPYTRSGTLANALTQAATMAWREKKHNAVVLLSPACASFDQWKSFEHRGDAFCEQVETMAKEARYAS